MSAPRKRRRFKGGTRNNGQPRITLVPGLTRVSQLKWALRELRSCALEDRAQQIIQQAIEGTYIPGHLRPSVAKARAGLIPHDPKDDEPEAHP